MILETELLPLSLSRSVVTDSFATPGTVARQAPLSMDSPGKNTREGSHSLFHGIFPDVGCVNYV